MDCPDKPGNDIKEWQIEDWVRDSFPVSLPDSFGQSIVELTSEKTP